MSQFEIIYTKERQLSPLSYWVHHSVGEINRGYDLSSAFHPPFPKKHPLKGYPNLVISVVGFEFRFASSVELEHCIDVLKQKHLPTTHQLSGIRGKGAGLNSHWLSRLPSHLKNWNKREKIVAALVKTRRLLESQKIDF